jgi:aryl-alcohol dehydrogenase-like predicted oxidoreductase
MTWDAVTAAAAGTWTLGDLTVNRMGFGAMRLPQTGRALAADAVPGDRGRAITVLRRAVELGVNHIDTAAFYFSALRSANELINTALAPYPDDLVIVTKVGPGRDPSGEWLPAARPDQLRGQVEENLRQLGRDRLDVVNWRNQQGIAFVPFFTIAGRGGGRGVTGAEHAEVLAIASAHGATAAQVRLAWTLQRGAHVLAIPGTGDPAHLTANVAASALRLSGEELALLESVTIPA